MAFRPGGCKANFFFDLVFKRRSQQTSGGSRRGPAAARRPKVGPNAQCSKVLAGGGGVVPLRTYENEHFPGEPLEMAMSP